MLADGQKLMKTDWIGGVKKRDRVVLGVMEARCYFLRLLSPCTAICLCHPAHTNPARRARFHPPTYYCTSLCSYIRQLAGGFCSFAVALLFPHSFLSVCSSPLNFSLHFLFHLSLFHVFFWLFAVMFSIPIFSQHFTSFMLHSSLPFFFLSSPSPNAVPPSVFIFAHLLLPPGPAGVTEAAQCRSVLPAADAAAADQQRSTAAEPGSCATGKGVCKLISKFHFVSFK